MVKWQNILSINQLSIVKSLVTRNSVASFKIKPLKKTPFISKIITNYSKERNEQIYIIYNKKRSNSTREIVTRFASLQSSQRVYGRR